MKLMQLLLNVISYFFGRIFMKNLSWTEFSENRKEDRQSDILPGMQTPDEEESHNKTATGFSEGSFIKKDVKEGFYQYLNWWKS